MVVHDVFVIYHDYITFQLTVVPSIQFGRVPRDAVQSAWASLTATTASLLQLERAIVVLGQKTRDVYPPAA